jgi:uncharacterized membrane protein
MMNHANGLMGGGMWLWSTITIALLILLVVAIARRPGK